MKKQMFLTVGLVLAFALVSHAQMTRYNSYVQVIEPNLSLTSHATAYVLTTATNTVVTVVARAGRAAGAYVVNLSSITCRITPINYGATGLIAARSVIANGVILEGIATPDSAGVNPTNGTSQYLNRFYLGDYVGAFYITLDDAGNSNTGSVAVYDVWR